MANLSTPARPAARLPKGFNDVEAAEIRALDQLMPTIRAVYERYGFEPLETPALEYSEALGKFLPDQDRPNEGVFSVEDGDGAWLSLRYDLTAPLARYVAANYTRLPKPFRRYAWGPVWRNEKPGPGRFRQFMQCDADTVGAEGVAADAEICMLAADTLEALGIPRGSYRIRVNSRKVLDGVLDQAGIDPSDSASARQRLIVLRAIDKLDRLGREGVAALLGKGRKDESGDFTEGAGLGARAIAKVMRFLEAGATPSADPLTAMESVVGRSAIGREGLRELAELRALTEAGGYSVERIALDPSIVRGLEYYTGPVFEAELTFESRNEEGEVARFGSVGAGGRYDALVARFTGERVPATGFSVGVSRLRAALAALGRAPAEAGKGPVVVLVLDKGELPRYQRMAQDLRNAGLRAEMYLGGGGLKAQMKYADKRGAPCVVIQGSDERAKGEVQIKDLVQGARLAQTIADAKEWREQRPAQFSVPEEEMVAAVAAIAAKAGACAA